MALVLHSHPLSSYCWKALIALYENGTPFEAQMINLGDPQARADYAALWPTARIPLMVDDGQAVPETSIMIEHLDRTHPGAVRLLPGDPDAQLRARLWDRLFDTYVMTPMQQYVAQQLRPEAERDARTMAEQEAALEAAYRLIEERLDPAPWAAGSEFSLADCAAAPALFYASPVVALPKAGRLADYFERLMARPSVQRVIEEARPWFQYYPLRERLPARYQSEGAAAG